MYYYYPDTKEYRKEKDSTCRCIPIYPGMTDIVVEAWTCIDQNGEYKGIDIALTYCDIRNRDDRRVREYTAKSHKVTLKGLRYFIANYSDIENGEEVVSCENIYLLSEL